jgi:hypothetical protein
LAAQPSKFPYWLNEFDRGGRSIDWEAVYKNVVKKDKLLGTMSHLTSSGHVVIGVSIHVGRDGDVREFAQNVDSFIRKPVEGVGGSRCTRDDLFEKMEQERSFSHACKTRLVISFGEGPRSVSATLTGWLAKVIKGPAHRVCAYVWATERELGNLPSYLHIAHWQVQVQVLVCCL